MSTDPQTVDGRVVIVTGASSGIGAAVTRALLAEGANVVAVARSVAALADLAGAHERSLAVMSADVRSLAAMEETVSIARERFGGLDAVICNAGVGEYAEFIDTSPETVEEIVGTNLLGTIWTIRAALSPMLGAGRGDVVIVSSVAAVMDPPGEVVYAASKAAQKALGAALDAELRTRGIRVTTLLPGGVRTAFAIGRGRQLDSPELETMLAPEDVADAILTVLTQRPMVRTTVWGMSHLAED